MWIPASPITRLRGDTFLLLSCCLPFPFLPHAQCEVLVACCVLCSGTVSGGFVSRQGRAPQLPNSALWNLSTSLPVAGLQISPLGTRLTTEQPHRLQYLPPLATRALAGRNTQQKAVGMFEMQALICTSSLLAAWREERARGGPDPVLGST